RTAPGCSASYLAKIGLYCRYDWPHAGHWKSLNFTTSTLAPSAGTISGTRGCDTYQRSNSDRWSCVGTGAAVAAADADGSPAAATLEPSRGKKASVEAAPAKNSTATVSASGLAAKTRTSREARRGSVVIG